MTYAEILTALDVDADGLIELVGADLRANGVLSPDQVAELPRVTAPELKVGDLVVMYGHQRYRAARVWKVGHKNVSAVYTTPSGTSFNNISGKPVALLVRVEGAEVDQPAAPTGIDESTATREELIDHLIAWGRSSDDDAECRAAQALMDRHGISCKDMADRARATAPAVGALALVAGMLPVAAELAGHLF